MTTEPTDAEIDALWRFEASKNWDSTLAMRTNFARKVLARWGTPAPVGVEPVAWKHDCAALLTNDVELWIDACPHCGKPRNAPQPMEREPLTDEQIKGLIEEGVFFGNCKEIVRAIEAAHCITGGQHGTE